MLDEFCATIIDEKPRKELMWNRNPFSLEQGRGGKNSFVKLFEINGVAFFNSKLSCPHCSRWSANVSCFGWRICTKSLLRDYLCKSSKFISDFFFCVSKKLFMINIHRDCYIHVFRSVGLDVEATYVASTFGRRKEQLARVYPHFLYVCVPTEFLAPITCFLGQLVIKTMSTDCSSSI